MNFVYVTDVRICNFNFHIARLRYASLDSDMDYQSTQISASLNSWIGETDDYMKLYNGKYAGVR